MSTGDALPPDELDDVEALRYALLIVEMISAKKAVGENRRADELAREKAAEVMRQLEQLAIHNLSRPHSDSFASAYEQFVNLEHSMRGFTDMHKDVCRMSVLNKIYHMHRGTPFLIRIENPANIHLYD
ncbi:unnamed protein product [Caenorhabditis bovis]|uniref:Uncharacterized protein n=1 Tax=Caenorhabditis bovis TaxID=2654633 RepID=A0A8S1ENS7_9PELO|nr:unnamed protein product [Caenorhabditis bovis]